MLRLSTALRNFVLKNGSLAQALQNGKIQIYSGTQPASADSAPTGTLLATITSNGGAHTAEVLATGTVTLTGGSAGAIDTLTVNGKNILGAAVPYNTSLSQTAADLAAAINKSLTDPEYTASAVGAVVTISAVRGTGAGPNGYVVAGSLTTLTATYGAFSGGVDAVNGLKFDVASAGAITKDAVQTWSGVAGNSGTAGWFRFVGSVADSGLDDGTASQIRLDGSVSTSGAQINMSSTAVSAGATQTLSAFSVTLPAN